MFFGELYAAYFLIVSSFGLKYLPHFIHCDINKDNLQIKMLLKGGIKSFCELKVILKCVHFVLIARYAGA